MASISPAGLEDADDLARIAAAAFDDPWSLDLFRTELQRPGTRALAARMDGRTVGYALAWRVLDTAELQSLAVEPASRGRGIARALVGEFIDALRKEGVSRLMLEVRESNRAALALYESFGMRREGRRPGYYSGGEAAVLLGMALG